MINKIKTIYQALLNKVLITFHIRKTGYIIDRQTYNQYKKSGKVYTRNLYHSLMWKLKILWWSIVDWINGR